MYKQSISQENVTEFIKHVQIRHANRKAAEKIIYKVNRKTPPANVFISAFALLDILKITLSEPEYVVEGYKNT